MFRKLKALVNTSDKKALIENFLSLSALQVVGMLLPLITLPYVLRVIGFEKYGLIVFANSLIAYFTSLTDFSFRITATREVANNKASPKRLSIIYSKVVIIKAIFLALSFLIIFSIVYLTPSFKDEVNVYFYSSLLLLGYALFPEWFFQGIEKMKYITYLNLGIKLFFTISVFVLVKDQSDYEIYPLLQSGGYIVAGLVGQYLLVKKYKMKLIALPWKHIRSTINKNFPLFINQFVPNLYNNTSTFLLGIIGTERMVGIYQAILTIVNLGITLLEICSRVFFPFLNRQIQAFGKYKKMMLIITSCLIVGFVFSNKLIFWYLGIEYEDALLILFVLLIGLGGYSLSNIFGLNFFIVRRQDILVMKITLIASIIGFLLAFPLIYYFSIVGAAINLSLSRIIMGGGLYYKYIQYNKGI